MSIKCALGRHSPSARTIWNDGYNFGLCTRCEADLVEVDGRWVCPPAGYRVVWKKRVAETAREPAAPPPQPVPAEAAKQSPVSRVDQRSPKDRRKGEAGELPSYLRGVDRRRVRDRRRGFGKKQAISFE